MSEDNDILELKFSGNNISPESVKPSEIAALLFNFEKVILSQLKSAEPTINTDEVLFCLDKIDNKSLDLIFKTVQVKPLLVNSFLSVATAFNTGDYSKIEKSAISSLNEIVKFSRTHNCIGYFNLNDQNISSFSPDVEISYNSANSITGETTIYGKIIRIGGEEPKIHFRTNDNEKLIFVVTENLAKQLSPKLYEYIGLVGTATWNVQNFNIDNFKVDRIIELQEKSYVETFDDLRGLIGRYWDEVEDIEEYLN